MGIYRIAEVLGLDKKYISFEIPGVNHFIWLTRFYYKGEDAYPLLDEWARKEAPKYWERCPSSDSLGPKPVDLYMKFGLFPIGDTCTPGGGAWPYWYHVDEETERRWKEDPARWWERYFKGLKARVDRILRTAKDLSIKVTETFSPRKSKESIVSLIESLACDISRIFQVNILNVGSFVPGIPQDFEVEIPALVSKRGIQGMRTTGLPKFIIAYIIRDRIAPVEIELEAYESSDKELLL